MEGDHIKICKWLIPFSWLYGFGVWLRNVMFDYRILPSESFDAPVINIGNITVGGTGKTPHTEYLIRLLSKDYKVAVLSRGYKRKSAGFQLATPEMQMPQIGDEPYQMKEKFPSVYVAVDANRRNGISQLLKLTKPPVEVVLLDDAYQHRYVKPGLNILLMDYHRLICFDRLLPAGRLREQRSGQDRADIVVVTKCPVHITPMERRGIERSLALFNWQKLFFSCFKYGNLYPLFDKGRDNLKLENIKDKTDAVLLLTGIASPLQLEADVKQYTAFTSLQFGDHHDFTTEDITKIEEAYSSLSGERKIIITTEKDSVRLLLCHLSEQLRQAIYVLPVEVEFINGRTKEFNKIIIDYVRKNSRNSSVLKRANDNKA